MLVWLVGNCLLSKGEYATPNQLRQHDYYHTLDWTETMVRRFILTPRVVSISSRTIALVQPGVATPQF
jgi:hypothetical protein